MRDRARGLGETGEQDRAASLQEVRTWGSAVTKSMQSVGRLETVRIPPVLGRFANATLGDGRGLRGICMLLRAVVERSGGVVTSNVDLLVAAVDDAPVDFPEKLAAALQAAQHQYQLNLRWPRLLCRCAELLRIINKETL